MFERSHSHLSSIQKTGKEESEFKKHRDGCSRSNLGLSKYRLVTAPSYRYRCPHTCTRDWFTVNPFLWSKKEHTVTVTVTMLLNECQFLNDFSAVHFLSQDDQRITKPNPNENFSTQKPKQGSDPQAGLRNEAIMIHDGSQLSWLVFL